MVGAVQQAARAADRRRKPSAPIGPPFIMPVLPMGKGDAPAGPAVTQAVASVAPSAPAAAPSCPNLSRFVGRSTGSGQCVALAQAVQPRIGPTRGWKCGDRVQGNTSLQPGTVIATFNKASHYANALDGSSHAAIYLGQNQKGVQVLDQWAGSRAAVRTIAWNNPGGAAANTGSAFHVVKSG
jgi:hypothetical protein